MIQRLAVLVVVAALAGCLSVKPKEEAAGQAFLEADRTQVANGNAGGREEEPLFSSEEVLDRVVPGVLGAYPDAVLLGMSGQEDDVDDGSLMGEATTDPVFGDGRLNQWFVYFRDAKGTFGVFISTVDGPLIIDARVTDPQEVTAPPLDSVQLMQQLEQDDVFAKHLRDYPGASVSYTLHGDAWIIHRYDRDAGGAGDYPEFLHATVRANGTVVKVSIPTEFSFLDDVHQEFSETLPLGSKQHKAQFTVPEGVGELLAVISVEAYDVVGHEPVGALALLDPSGNVKWTGVTPGWSQDARVSKPAAGTWTIVYEHDDDGLLIGGAIDAELSTSTPRDPSTVFL